MSDNDPSLDSQRLGTWITHTPPPIHMHDGIAYCALGARHKNPITGANNYADAAGPSQKKTLHVLWCNLEGFSTHNVTSRGLPYSFEYRAKSLRSFTYKSLN